MSTHAPPFVRRGLLALAAVATLLLGGAASAIAQTDEEVSQDDLAVTESQAPGVSGTLAPPTGIVVTEAPAPQLTLSPQIPVGDLTSEGTLHVDAPSNPVTVAPVPIMKKIFESELLTVYSDGMGQVVEIWHEPAPPDPHVSQTAPAVLGEAFITDWTDLYP